MRLEFSFDTADGMLFKRFDRRLPVEVWLCLRDLDEPADVDCIITPVSINMHRFGLDRSVPSLSAIFMQLLEAVNASLRLAQAEIETIPECSCRQGARCLACIERDGLTRPR